MKLSLSLEQFGPVLLLSLLMGILVAVIVFIICVRTHKIDPADPTKIAKHGLIIGLPMIAVFVVIPTWCADFLPIKTKIIITIVSLVFGAAPAYSIHLLAKATARFLNQRKKGDRG